MLRYRWSRLRRRRVDGAATIDEAIVGEAPWRWRTGRLNRRDDEMDDGSSSGEVDEGRRAGAERLGRRRGRGSGWAAVTWRTEEGGVSWLERRGYGGLGFRMAKRGRWEGVKHDLGTRLSKM